MHDRVTGSDDRDVVRASVEWRRDPPLHPEIAELAENTYWRVEGSAEIVTTQAHVEAGCCAASGEVHRVSGQLVGLSLKLVEYRVGADDDHLSRDCSRPGRLVGLGDRQRQIRCFPARGIAEHDR